MVVQIDALCFTSAAVPFEDQPPLLVDADRMEARKIAAQLLEMIAGRHTQILIGRRIVNHLELAKKTAFEIGRDVPGAGILDKESPQPYITKDHDHPGTPLRVYVPPYGTYELHKIFSPLFGSGPEETKDEAKKKIAKRFAYVDGTLAKHDYLLGDGFSVADAYLFVMTNWAMSF
jgi:hypothetical protein